MKSSSNSGPGCFSADNYVTGMDGTSVLIGELHVNDKLATILENEIVSTSMVFMLDKDRRSTSIISDIDRVS